MDIILDTSALIAVLTNEAARAKIVEISVGCNLVAPKSVHWEVGNALSAMIKRDRIKLNLAKKCLAAYREIPIKFVDVDLVQTLELVHSLKLYAYDAYLIRAALEAGAPLLTLDSGLKHAAQRVGVELLEV